MVKRLKARSLAEAVNYFLQSNGSDLGFSVGGLSSDEEEKFITYYWKTFPLMQRG